MVGAGVLYVLFEKFIVQSPETAIQTLTESPLSKSILGMQIGLIVLAMVVTRSSIASLQAKRGLPLGNQVTGWLILGTTSTEFNSPSSI